MCCEKVSIIVPIYNSEKYLEKCIKSILGQTYPDIEVILVNDGSSDGSLDICRKYQEIDSRINVISQANRGLVAARKAGLAIAKGQFIGFVDSDDWIEADMYEHMIRVYREYHPELISTGIFRDYEGERRSVEVYDHFAEGCYQNLDEDIYPTMLRDPKARDFGLYCTLPNKLFLNGKLQTVYENIDINVFYGEDCMAVYPYCLSVDSIYISKKAYYHYNIRKGSMCRMADGRLAQNAYLLYRELERAFLRYSHPEVLMKQLKRYMIDIEAHNMKMLYGIDFNIFGKWQFSYQNYYDSKIVIYGAGICGQALYHQICNERGKDCIAAWIDQDYRNKRRQCLVPIEPPEILPRLRFDYIIIAVVDPALAARIRFFLIKKYGIQDEVIIWKMVRHESLFGELF